MMFLGLAMFMALFQTAVFWLMSRHFQNKEHRERIWIVCFTFIMVYACMKWKLSEWKWLSVLSHIVFMAAWYGLMKKETGAKSGKIVVTMILAIVISLAGDSVAILILYRSGPGVVEDAEQIGSPGYLQGVLTSYGVQMLLSMLYAYFKEWTETRQADKTTAEVSDRKKDQRRDFVELLVFLLISQFFVLLFALILVNLQRTYTSAIWPPYIVIQCVVAAAIFWVIRRQMGDEELQDMKQCLAAMETWNQDIYYHYRNLEQSYEKLHRLRHDFRNLLNAACAARQAGDENSAKQILAEMEKMIDGEGKHERE